MDETPHMHIFNSSKSFEACVCIYTNEYYIYHGKHGDTFTDSQLKEFDEWLKQKKRKRYIMIEKIGFILEICGMG